MTTVKRSGAAQRAANLQRAEQGTARWTQPRPFGFDRQDGTVTTVPAEAGALIWAAEKLLADESLRSVAQALNRQGFRTTKGNEWAGWSLRRALLNPRVSGVQVYRGQRLGPGNWPAILSPKTQERLAEKLGAPARRRQESTEPQWLLSGIARCGRCGGRMWAMGRRGVYICRDGGGHLSRQAEDVDAYVRSVAPTMFARSKHPVSGSSEEAATYRKLEAVRRRQEVLERLAADEGLPADAVQAGAAVLAEEERALAATLSTPQRRAFFGRVATAQERWDSLDLMSQRQLLADNLSIVIKPIGRGVRAPVEDYVEITPKGSAT